MNIKNTIIFPRMELRLPELSSRSFKLVRWLVLFSFGWLIGEDEDYLSSLVSVAFVLVSN